MADILAMMCLTVFDGVITECGITRELAHCPGISPGQADMHPTCRTSHCPAVSVVPSAALRAQVLLL